MSETKRRARKAKQELEVTQAAFNSLHADLVEATFEAEDAESAYEAVLAVKALRKVRALMASELDSEMIEEEAEQYAD